jgi:hypothetical protein
VEGEQHVVGLVVEEGRPWSEELQSQEEPEHPPEEEEEEGGEEVHHPDPLVVEGVGPGAEALFGQVAAVVMRCVLSVGRHN